MRVRKQKSRSTIPNDDGSVLREVELVKNRAGRKCIGLYPEVSRTKLAKLTGKHITTITGIFRGRTRPPLETAVVIAQAIGVEVVTLSVILAGQQKAYRREKRREKMKWERAERAARLAARDGSVE